MCYFYPSYNRVSQRQRQPLRHPEEQRGPEVGQREAVEGERGFEGEGQHPPRHARSENVSAEASEAGLRRHQSNKLEPVKSKILENIFFYFAPFVSPNKDFYPRIRPVG